MTPTEKFLQFKLLVDRVQGEDGLLGEIRAQGQVHLHVSVSDEYRFLPPFHLTMVTSCDQEANFNEQFCASSG